MTVNGVAIQPVVCGLLGSTSGFYGVWKPVPQLKEPPSETGKTQVQKNKSLRIGISFHETGQPTVPPPPAPIKYFWSTVVGKAFHKVLTGIELLKQDVLHQ